jgi:hypothetical protein
MSVGWNWKVSPPTMLQRSRFNCLLSARQIMASVEISHSHTVSTFQLSVRMSGI